MPRSWATSARKPARAAERPFGSWDAAIERARRSWDGLTGHEGDDYSDLAAASILRTAVALWPQVARAMVAPGDTDET